MGIRIKINWTFLSPSLQVASGILRAEVVQNGTAIKLLFKCGVRKERGSLGYSSMDANDESMGANDESLSIPYKLFEELRPTIDIMVRSYCRGMLLEKSDYEWIDDSLDKPFEEWAKEKGLNPD